MSSNSPRDPRRQRLLPGRDRPGQRRLLLVATILPMGWLLLAVVGLTLYCRNLLVEAAAGRLVRIGELELLLVAGGFLMASAAVVLLQSWRVAARVAGPEYRLCHALQRIRSGDLAFRVHLRRGDLLGGLAAECNQLLDWLNQNPPAGVRTGSDVVEVDAAAERTASPPELAEEVGVP